MEKRQTPQQNMRNVRAIALDILLQVMEEGKYCDRTLHRTLNREDTLSKQQRAFLTRLVEGTVEQAIRLDYIIDCFSKTKVVKMKPVIRETLRMAVYQLFYMDQVPDSAACNEAVKLVRKRGLKGLSGFVNGVLRSVIRDKDQIKYPDAKDFISYASIKYSMPGWIIEYFLEEYSEAETEQILQPSYLVRIMDGKVVIQHPDGSVYEATEISEESLPMSVREKIQEEYRLNSRQELYSFLENYSS